MAKNLVEIIVTAEDKASGVLKGIGGSLQSVGTMAVAGIGVGVAALGSLGAGIVSLASHAAPIAGVKDGFEALTSSMTGGSAAMIAALQDASGGLITNTELMQSFNTAASLVSKDFAEQLPGAMGYLSKVAAATGQDMNYMLDSLVKGVGRLSPMILDNLGIQVNLTEANEIYAKSIGKSVDELTKAEQQTALMNQVMEKLAANTEGMEGLSNPFEKFKITMANLKDEIGLRLLPVVAPLMEKFGELAARAIPLLMDKVEFFIGKLQTLSGVILSFIGNLEGGMSPLDAFIKAIAGIVPMEMLIALIDFRDNVLPGLMARFTEMKDRVMEIVTPIAEAIVQFVSWKDVLIGLAAGIAAILIPAIIGIVTSMAPILLIVGAVIAVVALLRNAWEQNWGDIQGKTQAVIDFIKPLIQNALAAIRAWWAENGAAIIAAVQNAWTTIQTAISTVITTIQTVINNALSLIRGWWQQHGEAIVTAARQAWELIQGVINRVVEQIKQIVAAFRLAFEGDWRGFGEKLREIWETSWKMIVEFLSGLWNMVQPKVAELWNRLKSWFTTTDWESLGVSIVQGIINGLHSMIQAAVSAAMAVGGAIKDAIAGFFGISSPSRLMHWFGVNLGEGLVNGIRAMTGKVGDAIEDMTGGAMRGFNMRLGGVRMGSALAPVGVGGRVAQVAAGRPTVVVNIGTIDARGAARGVETDIRRSLDGLMRDYGRSADARIRTGG